MRMHYRLRARIADKMLSKPRKQRFVSEKDVVMEMESMEARGHLFELAKSSSDGTTGEPELVTYS